MKGDDLMGDQLFDYMKARSDKIAEKDENKKKVAAIRKELYQRKGINIIYIAMEEESCGEYRGAEDE
jgi:hypothetical protein